MILISLLQIFDMVDAKARQDCIKEIDLLKVGDAHRVSSPSHLSFS